MTQTRGAEGRTVPGASGGERLRKTVLDTGERLVYRVEDALLRSSTIPITPFIDPDALAGSAILEAGWKDIRAELDELLRYRDDLPNVGDISIDAKPLGAGDRWKSFFLIGWGRWSVRARERCPQTAALLDQFPGLTTAFFSILLPHTKLSPHRGPYRGLLRYHLGLRVPDPSESCGINVAGETRHWEEGKSLVFDDGYRHHAWNDSDEVRVVLFADVLRPMRRPASDINRAVVNGISWTPFLLDAKRRHADWERRFEALGY